MAGATVDAGTEYLWRSYAKQITQKLAGGGNLGDTNAIFICPLTTQGVASGEHICPEMTNNQLFRAVDSLLDPRSPVYVPGEGSYYNTVASYLRHVFLAKNPAREAIIRFTGAEKEAKRARTVYLQDLRDTKEEYFEIEGQRAPAGTAGIEAWAAQNHPSLIRNKDALQAAENTVMQIQAEINGPAAADLNRQLQGVIKAGDAQSPQPGYNMPCVEADIDKVEDMRNGINTKLEGVFYRPSYSLQGFSSQVTDWIKVDATTVADQISFSISDGKRTSWATSGFSKVESKANASAWCFLQSSASASSHSSNASLSIDGSTSSIEVNITFKGLKAFPIGIGRWDVPDLTRQYPNLAPGSPPELVRGLARAERILIGYAPGMTVKFDANTFKQAISIMENAQSAGASVSLFGFCIGGSASAGAHSGGATSFDNVAVNKQGFTITIPPISSTFPVCVGVLAKRV